jgi:hypothetical protein
MDWIGDKLSQLIEEGRKALNREIVVMSDVKEDEVDDVSGAWEEVQPQVASPPVSPIPIPIPRSSSVKRIRKPLVDPSFHFSSSAPASTSFMSTTPRITYSHSRSTLDLTVTEAGASIREGEHSWESPELRVSMERARARAQARMGISSYRRGT